MNPWELRPDIWSTKSKFMVWVRGGIRRGLWNQHPIKLEYINKNIEKTFVGYYKNGKEKWLKMGTCEICQGQFKAAQLEVDHIKGNHQLKTMEDVQSFIESMIIVTDEDLQLVCRGCHEIKTHAERYDLSFEEARLDKQVVKFGKLGINEQLGLLYWMGIVPAKNAEKRKEQIREVLKRGTE